MVDVLRLSARISGVGPDFDPVTRTAPQAARVAAWITLAGSFSRAIALWFLVGAAGTAPPAMVPAR